jgi:hypothetical protein
MLVEEFFVHCMNMSMVLDATSRTAIIKKFLEPRHVRSISNNGLDILHSIAVKLWQVCEGSFSILVNSCHGSLHSLDILNLMMNLLLRKCKEITTFPPHGSIVLKPFVHHVGL